MRKNTIISRKTYVDLYNYLATHEGDIANDINDFGTLKSVFIEIIGRVPK